MTTRQKSRLPFILFALVLVAAAGWALQNPESLKQITCFFTGQSEKGTGHSHDHNDHHHSGWHFSKEELTLELSIFESGTPPQFRVKARNAAGDPIPPAGIELAIKLTRLGGQVDSFSFIPIEDGFASYEVVTEPHSFEAEVQAKWQGKTYQWNFSQVEARTEISAEMARLSGIETTKAAPTTLSVLQTFTGEVGLDEGKVAHVVPRLNSVVKDVIQHLGDWVQKGETLAVMESRELADAKNLHLHARKKLEPALLDLERQQLLYDNTSKMLELLNSGSNLEALDKQLDAMILGEARAQLVPAFASWKQTHAAFLRESSLYEKKISSQSDFLTAREQYQSAEARYHALREKIAYSSRLNLIEKKKAVEKLQLDVKTSREKLISLGLTREEIEQLSFDEEQNFTRYTLRSPLSGEVIQKHLAVGEVVARNDDIYVIANLSTLWVNIAIPARHLAAVRVGQKVHIREEHQGLRTTGKLSYLGAVIDETTRSVTGRVVISNPKKIWRPGMYVSVDLVQDEIRVPVAVDVEAVQKYRDWDVVFVHYGDFYEARPVTLGQTDGNHIEIIEGLRVGEPYVSKNSFAIKAELGKSGATHSH